MVDEKRLKEIQERADKADPGPWTCFLGSGMNVCTAVGYDRQDGGVTIICDCLTEHMLESGHAAADHIPNMKFIEYAREDVPELVAEVKTAVTLLKRVVYRMNEGPSFWGDAFSDKEYNEIVDFLAKYGTSWKD